MRRRRACLALLLLLAALAAVSAAAAAPPTTGTHIGLMPGLTGPLVYPADTPFFVEHGFGCGPDQAAVDAHTDNCLDPQTRFTVSVDGRQMPSTTVLDVDAGGTMQSKLNLTNFRFGLPAGQHVFHGQWWHDGTLVLDS